MNDYSPDAGGGCLLPLAAALIIAFGIMMSLGDHTSSHNTTPVLSGNEVMSRNQINVLSDVQNNYYDCIGSYSCVTTDNSTVITSTTNAPVNVDGERNTIYSSSGQLLCPNPANPNQWGDVAAWCESAGVTQPQP